MTTLAELTAQTAHTLRSGALAADPGDRTRAYRRTAELIIDARQRHFASLDGEPDWTGRTGACRSWLGEVYDAAGIRKGGRTKVAAAVRYHVGALLRLRMGTETMMSLGLAPASPRERAAVSTANQTDPVCIMSDPRATLGGEQARGLAWLAAARHGAVHGPSPCPSAPTPCTGTPT